MYGRCSEISLGRTYSALTRRGAAKSTTSASAISAARNQRPIATNTAAAMHAKITSHCSGSPIF